MQSFDYIIVGAGSAGCALASRLSEDSQCSVLLVEAGNEARHPLIGMPLGFGRLLGRKDLTWGYWTEAEPGNANRPAYWVRGKVVGGSSAINGMIYCRGQASDYDDWASDGLTEWSWSKMAPVFRSIENYTVGAVVSPRSAGPLTVSLQQKPTQLTEAILNAGDRLGIPRRLDVNGEADPDGMGYAPLTVDRGRRVSAADAFLTPARKRSNLTVVTQMQVERLQFDGRRATGIVGMRRGRRQVFLAGREIILSAGALNTPQLLLLSGVGPADQLQTLGIEVVHDLPDVGRNLREHKNIAIDYRLKQSRWSHNRELSGWRACFNGARYFLGRTGPMRASYDLNAFVRTRPELVRPDAQLILWALTFETSRGIAVPEAQPGLRAMGYPLRSRSTGELRLRDPDPTSPPLIRANFLSDPYDGEVLIGLFRKIRALFSDPAVTPFVEQELSPGADVETDADILDLARRSGTCLHTVGTCRMGTDARAVVDQRLRVNGILGLRIADLSVAPTQISGNTNGPAMAIGWRAGDLIKEDWSRARRP